MNEQEFLRLLESVAECEQGELTLETPLTEIVGWDSVAVIGLISGVHQKFGLRMAPAGIGTCRRAGDLFDLAKNSPAG